MYFPSNNHALENLRMIPAEVLAEYPVIEEWAEAHRAADTDESAEDALAHLHDAQSGIGEDFLQGDIDHLRDILGDMRKSETRGRLSTVLESLEALQARIAQAIEYETENLNKARAVLEGTDHA